MRVSLSYCPNCPMCPIVQCPNSAVNTILTADPLHSFWR